MKRPQNVNKQYPDKTNWCQMPNSCIVAGCKNREGKNGVKMYRIPLIRRYQGSRIEEMTQRRQQLWLAAIDREDLKTVHLTNCHRVCSMHFYNGKPASYQSDKHVDWVPHLDSVYGRTVSKEPPPIYSLDDFNLRLRRTNTERATAATLLKLSSYLTPTPEPVTKIEPCEEEPEPLNDTKTVSVQTDLTGIQMDREKKAIRDLQLKLAQLQKEFEEVFQE